MASTHEKYFTALEWILFICLCGLSLFFADGVVDKFLAAKSSFAQSEEVSKELPRFTLCFTKPELKRTNYEHGKDFKIKYESGLVSNRSFIFLEEEGKKSFVLPKEAVYFEKMIGEFLGNCYKITAESEYSSLMRSMVIYFNESIPQEDLPTLTAFITSEKNSNGAAYSNWKNGLATKVEIENGFTKIYSLKAEQYNYLSGDSNSKCSNESFYECWGRMFSKELLNNKSTNCNSFSMPSLSICKTNETHVNIRDKIFTDIMINELCPKLCKTLEYSGFETWNKGITPYYPNATFGLGFLFQNMATVHEEYVIYDAVNMIGSVGGTLGMCIGFSFTGVISFFIRLLQKGIGKLRSFLRSPKVSPHTSKVRNGGLLYTLNRKTSLNANDNKSSVAQEINGNENLKIYLQDKEKLQEVMNTKFAAIEKTLEYLMNNAYNSSGQ